MENELLSGDLLGLHCTGLASGACLHLEVCLFCCVGYVSFGLHFVARPVERTGNIVMAVAGDSFPFGF